MLDSHHRYALAFGPQPPALRAQFTRQLRISSSIQPSKVRHAFAIQCRVNENHGVCVTLAR
jgi:hypothetical protein